MNSITAAAIGTIDAIAIPVISPASSPSSLSRGSVISRSVWMGGFVSVGLGSVFVMSAGVLPGGLDGGGESLAVGDGGGVPLAGVEPDGGFVVVGTSAVAGAVLGGSAIAPDGDSAAAGAAAGTVAGALDAAVSDVGSPATCTMKCEF